MRPRSPVATGSDPLSIDLLVAGKASRPAVSQLATTHRRDQAHANEKRARGPASASDSKEPSQVRTRLSAGGKWIRTLGPAPNALRLDTAFLSLVEIKALLLALVGGSPGAEGVFLNQNLAIRSTSVF